jgi:hypothetical protein
MANFKNINLAGASIMRLIWNLTILILMSSYGAYGNENARSCQSKDLRDELTMPQWSQIYTKSDQIYDAQWCYAATLANLVGQHVGVAVSAEDIAIKTWMKEFVPYGPPFLSHTGDPNTGDVFPGGGSPDWSYEGMRNEGFCPATKFSIFLESLSSKEAWYTNLLNLVKTTTPTSFMSSVDKACGNRISLDATYRVNRYFVGKLVEERLLRDLGVTNPPPEKTAEYSKKLVQELIRQINSSLKRGEVVGFIYLNPKINLHVVTIVGQSKDCNYIIQDSEPFSHLHSMGADTFFSGHDGEHFQHWSEKNLSDALLDYAWSGIVLLERNSAR